MLCDPEKNQFLHLFIKKESQYRYGSTLDEIQRSYADHDKGGNTVHAAVDAGAHGDDAFHGQTEQLGKFRQQIDGIEGGAEECHDEGSGSKSPDSAGLCLFNMVLTLKSDFILL